MDKKKLYLVVGKSGSGKDYIVDRICKDFNKTKAISRTTRKPRFEGENTHKFVSESQADREFNKSVAKTFYNGNRYYTLIEDLLESDFYIIDPEGVYSIDDNNLSQFDVTTIYIDVKWHRRIKNMRKRGDSFKSIFKRLWNDRKAFKGFKGDIEPVNTHMLYEWFKMGCLD